MSIIARVFEWFYTQSLRFYPHGFRAKFGDEMQMVFSNGMENAKKGDILMLLAFSWREIRDLPMSILHEHLRSRKGEKMKLILERWRSFLTEKRDFSSLINTLRT